MSPLWSHDPSRLSVLLRLRSRGDAAYSSGTGATGSCSSSVGPYGSRCVCGVCADVWVECDPGSRILLIVLTPFHLGLGFIAYVVAWIVIPEESFLAYPAPPPPPLTSV